MSRKLRDKYRRRFKVTSPGILGADIGEVAEEKLIRVISTGLDISTVIYIEVSHTNSEVWTRLGSITSTQEKIFDISLYDNIRYNVFTFGGTEATLEAVSAVSSDQNIISKDIEDLDSYRVLDRIPPDGDTKTAFLNALLTLTFWNDTGYPIGTIDFVITDDGEPVLDRYGNFIEV